MERDWSIATKALVGEKGKVRALRAVRLKWQDGKSTEIPGSEFELPADLVLLAMGFVSPVRSLLEEFGVEQDARGMPGRRRMTHSRSDLGEEDIPAGDMPAPVPRRLGDPRGRQCARAVDAFLMGASELPR